MRWLVERSAAIGYVVVVVVSASVGVLGGQHGHMLLHAHPNRGSGILYLWRSQKVKLEKMVRNCDEERINDKTKLKPPVLMQENTVRLICLLALSVICWVFVRTSFLQNPEKNGHLLLTKPCVLIILSLILNMNGYKLCGNDCSFLILSNMDPFYADSYNTR